MKTTKRTKTQYKGVSHYLSFCGKEFYYANITRTVNGEPRRLSVFKETLREAAKAIDLQLITWGFEPVNGTLRRKEA